MSRSIDQRIVEMQFNNSQFEKGIDTSLKSLDNLKKGLNLDSKSALAGIASGVDQIASKFTTLGIMGVTAIQNITNRLVDMGLNMARALTVAPVSDGYREYEMVLKSVQTTMAGTGKTAGEVQKELQKLDQYADETVFSTSDMLSNLPKFTNAGVDLAVATNAMIGIANATALAGGGAREASIAFYNLGQSIGTGYLTRMDYNSINNAGIATMEWKNQMVQAAIAEGKLTKTTEGLYQANGKTFTLQSLFIDGLQEQWASASVLTKVFGDYGDATTEIGAKASVAATQIRDFSMLMETLSATAGTGWKTTWDIIIGDLDRATALWTEVGNALGDMLSNSADARNKILEDWAALGGRVELIESIRNIIEATSSIINAFREVLREFIPPMTGERLEEITYQIYAFTYSLKPSAEFLEQLKTALRGVFSILKVGFEAFKFIIKIGVEFINVFVKPIVKWLWDLVVGFSAFATELTNVTDISTFFENAFVRVKEVFVTIAETISNAVQRIKDAIGGFGKVNLSPLDSFSKESEEKLKPLSKLAELISKAFEAIVKVIEWVAPIIKKIGGAIGNALKGLGTNILSSLGNLSLGDIGNLVETGLFAALILKLKGFVKSAKGITDGFKGLFDGITGVLDGVKGALKGFQNELNSKALKNIAIAIAILAASLLVLSTIPEEKLNVAISGITMLFAELVATMAVLTKFTGQSKLIKMAASMALMSAAILILSVALKNLASLEWEEIAKGATGVAALAAILIGVSQGLSKNSKKMIQAGIGVIGFATAILIMSHAMENISALSWESIGKGLAVITVIMGEFVVVTRLISKNSAKMLSAGLSMIEMGAAMIIFAKALGMFAMFSWDEIAHGLVAMGGALAEVVIALNLLPKNVLVKATSMVVMGAALQILASAMSKFNNMSWDEIAHGLVAMGGALAEVVIALNLLPKGMVTKAAGMVVVGAALHIIAGAMSKFNNMSWDEIAHGLVAMGGALGILVISLNLMRKALPGAAAMLIVSPALIVLAGALRILGGMSYDELIKSMIGLGGSMLSLAIGLNVMGVKAIAGAAAMLIVAPALLILAAALRIIGTMSWGAIGVALVGIAGSLLIFGVVAKVLGSAIPQMMALGVAMLLLGSGLTLVGLGLVLVAGGLGLLLVDVKELIVSLPVLFEAFGKSLVALFVAIKDSAPELFEAIKVLVLEALRLLRDIVPEISTTVIELLIGILTTIDDNLPVIVDKVFNILLQILYKLKDYIPEFVKIGIELVKTFFTSVFGGLGDFNITQVLELIGFIAALIGVMYILKAVRATVKDALIAAAGMVAIAAMFAILIAGISLIPIDNFADIALGLGAGLVEMAAAMFILSKIPVQAAIVAVEALAIFVAGLTIVVAALGGLAQIPGFEWLLNEGKRIFQILGEAIGGFLGGIVGGAMSAISDSLPKIADNLSAFATRLQPFIDGIKQIDSKAINATKALGEMMLVFTASNILDGIASAILGDKMGTITEFAEDLAPMGQALANFATEVKDINAEDVEHAANAALTLAQFAKSLPRQGGWIQSIIGELTSISSLAEGMKALAPALVKFADEVKDLNAEDIENAVTAATMISEFAGTLQRRGGLWQDIIGEIDSLSSFADQLNKFAPALVKYAETVKDLSKDDIEKSVIAAQMLSDLANNLPRHSGIVQMWTGDNSLALFGKELSIFGPYLAKYAESISSITNYEDLKAATKVTGQIIDIVSELPPTGGIVQAWVGSQSLGRFGMELAALGPGLADFDKAVKKIDDFNKMNMAAKAAKSIAEVVATINANPGAIQWGWFSKDSGLAAITNGLKEFGTALVDFNTELGTFSKEDGANVERAAKAASALASINTKFEPSPFIAWFVGEHQSLTDFATDLAPLGEAMAEFASKVGTIENWESMVAAANAASALADAAGKTPLEIKEDSFFYWLTPTRKLTLSEFITSLAGVGTQLKEFSKELVGYKHETVLRALESIQAFVTASGQLPVVITQDDPNLRRQTFDELADDLQTFAGDMNYFFALTSGWTSTKVDIPIGVVTDLAAISDTVSHYELGSLSNFGHNLLDFGKSIGTWFFNMEALDRAKIYAWVGVFRSLIEVLSTLTYENSQNIIEFGLTLKEQGDMGVEKFLSSFEGVDVQQRVRTAINTMFDTLIAEIRQAYGFGPGTVTAAMKSLSAALVGALAGVDILKEYLEAGKAIVKTIVFGIETEAKSLTIMKSVTKMIDGSIAQVRTRDKEWENVGYWIPWSIIAGINAYDSLVIDRMFTLGKEMEESFRNATDVHSESDLYKEIGEFVPESVKTGIDEKGYLPTEAIETVAQDMVKMFRAEGITAEDANAMMNEAAWAISTNTSMTAATKIRAVELKNAIFDAFNATSSSDGAKYDVFWDQETEKVESSRDKAIREVAENTQKKLGRDVEVPFIKNLVNKTMEDLGISYGQEMGISTTNGIEQGLVDSLDKAGSGGGGGGSATEKSAEELAKELAEAIKKPFMEEFEALSLRETTLNLEKQLWDVMNAGLSAAEKHAKEMTYLNDLMAIQTERADITERQHVAILEKFDETSKEANETYNQTLEERRKSMEATKALTEEIIASINAEAAALDRYKSIVEAEFSLWEAKNPKATDAEKTLKQQELLNKNLAIQNNKTVLAQQEYEQIMSDANTTAEERENAWIKAVQAQTDLANLVNEVTEMSTVATSNQTQAFLAYADFLTKMTDGLKQSGFTMEQIQEQARLATGWVDPSMAKSSSNEALNNANKILSGDITTIGSVYQQAVSSTFAPIAIDFNKAGTQFGEALNQGLTETQPDLVTKTSKIMEDLIQVVKNKELEWVTLGKNAVDGFTKGIIDNKQTAIQAAITMATSALEAAMKAIGANSPATEFIKMGEYADLGLALGLSKFTYLAENEARSSGESIMDAMRNSLSNISAIVSDEINLTPTIRPVIDLTDVVNGSSSISDMFNQQFDLTHSIDRANTAMAGREMASQALTNAAASQQFIFEQNNYSPKALSKVDIYRQTRNQFSALKGVLSSV